MSKKLIEEIKSKLLNIGLTENDIDIIIYLFQHIASANKISKDLNINRTFVYDRIKKLMNLGFISKIIKEGKTKFRANKKEIIINAYKQELAIKENSLKRALELLDKLEIKEEKPVDINIFTGNKSIFYILNNIIKEKPREIFIMGSLKILKEKLDYYFENFDKRRNENKIKIYAIINKYIELRNTEIEFIEEKQYSTNIFYKNKSILILWLEQPIAIYIEDKNFTEVNIEVIKSIFDKKIKIYNTKEGIEYAYMKLLKKKNTTLQTFGYMTIEYKKVYSDEFAEKWQTLCKKNNITVLSLHNEEKPLPKKMVQRSKKYGVINFRFLPKIMNGPVAIYLSEDFVLQIAYALEKPQVILMQDKEMVKIYKEHFKKLWTIAKKRKI